MQRLFRNSLIKSQLSNGRVHHSTTPRSPLSPYQYTELARPQKFKVGEPAIYAHNQIHQYPENYRPWAFNYTGNGFLIAATGLGYFSYFQLENYWKELCEYDERPKNRKYYKI